MRDSENERPWRPDDYPAPEPITAPMYGHRRAATPAARVVVVYDDWRARTEDAEALDAEYGDALRALGASLRILL